jgi:Flp pilus assembly pilin Flp
MRVRWVGRAARHRDDQGAQAVEFALVVPILLAVVFGIITFGFLFGQQLMMDNAVRQGARYGAVADRTCEDVHQETLDVVSGGLVFNPSTVGILVTRDGATVCGSNPSTSVVKPCAGSSPGANVEVTATYASSPLGFSTVDLQAKGTFRCEFS